MKITCEKEELLKAVTTVSRLATTRATLPILQNIFLLVKKNHLTLKATDLEQTLEVEVVGQGESDGQLTVPARVLVEYLQNNTDKSITLTGSDVTLLINSTSHSAKVKGIAADDYPDLPKITFQADTSLPSSVLLELVSKTLFAAASDETRPILTGLLFKFTSSEMTVVGTDGYRLAFASHPVSTSISGDYILPKRSLQELVRLLGIDEETTLSFSATQARIKIGSVTFITRVMDGNFPPYESIIPKKSSFSLNLNAAALLQSLKLASLFSRDSAFSTKLEVTETKIIITAVSPMLGESTNEIAITGGPAEKLTISVNAQYLIDALTTLGGEITLALIDAKSPVVLTVPKDKNYLYLLMPLRSE